MDTFTEIVRTLVLEGSVCLRMPPRLPHELRANVIEVLKSAYAEASLFVAGPPIAFHAATALAATQFVLWSCWFLLHRGEPDADVESVLVPPPPARSAAEHLSADLLFRHLPVVHRRARAVNPRDVLTLRLEEVLRSWPLSGVLADIDPPLVPVELGGHHGLLLLYAERLAANRRPGWCPAEGPVREYIELVNASLGGT